ARARDGLGRGHGQRYRPEPHAHRADPPPLGPAHTGAAGRRDRPHAAPAGGRGGGSSAGDLLPGFPRRGLRHRRDHRRDRRRLIGSARNSHRRKEPNMIYEIRTYRIAPGSLAEVEKRYGEAYEYRKKYSELTAFWHTEIGPLNEIVHVWGYSSLDQRARERDEARQHGVWPPPGGADRLLTQENKVLLPSAFSPLQ